MGTWQPNPACGCGRCRGGGLMGPVVLVTLGVLFLLSEWHVLSFGRSWPILVIAIGLVLVVNSATASSHRAPEPPASVLPPDTAGPSQKEVDHV